MDWTYLVGTIKYVIDRKAMKVEIWTEMKPAVYPNP